MISTGIEPQLTKEQVVEEDHGIGKKLKPANIMVVDDEPDLEILFKQIFRRDIQSETYRFIFADNGQEALDILRNGDPVHMVLCDIRMPVMDGLELLGHLKAEFPHLKTVMVTAYGDMEKIRNSMNNGAFDFICKPINYNDLRFTMRRTLDEVAQMLAASQTKSEQEQELAKAQALSLEYAHAAGKAEFATTVLHNVGNILNSLNVSCYKVSGRVSESYWLGVKKAVGLLTKHRSSIGDFLVKNEKGKRLLPYLGTVASSLKEDYQQLTEEIAGMRRNIQIMAEIIETQQSHANSDSTLALHSLESLIDESLGILSNLFQSANIQVIKEMDEGLQVYCHRTLAIHVFVNLLKNSAEAMEDSPKRKLTISQRSQNQTTILEMKDTGSGFDQQAQIFARGFTTKRMGHGFGLYFCRKALEAMGGRIEATSDGLSKGATFWLTLKSPNTESLSINDLPPLP